ncbi:MAG: sugar phosphate nucleotidyltransferase [Bacteroidetes bacterium]|nr:sugar phosphate nucleotidyltransferase [Bacteroidota bacterium]
MRAIIPVAGIGSRLRPHTNTIPKVMLSIAGKPIIGHIMDKIISEGITEATIIVGYLGDLVIEYIQKNYKIKVDFIEQEERLGLGHAIYLSKNTISNDPILIILGDTIFEIDLKKMINQNYSAIGVHPVDDAKRFGIAEIENGFIKSLVEKPENPKSNLAIVGVYYIQNPKLLIEELEKNILNNKKTKNEFQLTDALQQLIERGEKILPFEIEGWYDCGKPETLISTNEHLLRNAKNHYAIPTVITIPPVFISPKAVVKNSVIGPNVTIAENTNIANCIIKNSIINEGAIVKNSVLEHSIIGTNAIVVDNFRKINIGDSSELEFN